MSPRPRKVPTRHELPLRLKHQREALKSGLLKAGFTAKQVARQNSSSLRRRKNLTPENQRFVDQAKGGLASINSIERELAAGNCTLAVSMAYDLGIEDGERGSKMIRGIGPRKAVAAINAKKQARTAVFIAKAEEIAAGDPTARKKEIYNATCDALKESQWITYTAFCAHFRPRAGKNP